MKNKETLQWLEEKKADILIVTIDDEHYLQITIQGNQTDPLYCELCLSEMMHYTMGWHIQQISELLKAMEQYG